MNPKNTTSKNLREKHEEGGDALKPRECRVTHKWVATVDEEEAVPEMRRATQRIRMNIALTTNSWQP